MAACSGIRTWQVDSYAFAFGAGIAGLTAAAPKAMLKVQGRPILARLLDDLGHVGAPQPALAMATIQPRFQFASLG